MLAGVGAGEVHDIEEGSLHPAVPVPASLSVL